MAKEKVLVTGASGLIGQLTVEALADRYDFTGLNRRPMASIPSVQGDISNLEAIRPAFRDVDKVLHLAAYTEDVDCWPETMAITVNGTLNVFRAAQEAGVSRVVFMSSGSTMCGYEWGEGSPYGLMASGRYQEVPDAWPMVSTDWAPRPDSPYAVGKLFGEACGRYFADRYNMSVIVIRLGAVLDTDRPQLRRHFPGYLSQSDAIQMIDKCLSAPDQMNYRIFDAISENRWRWRDTTPAKTELGWDPIGSSDSFQMDFDE